MRRVAVTGMGITSCLGNSPREVLESLREGRSGLHFDAGFAEMGLRSQVSGCVDLDLDALIDRRQRRFMGDSAGYAYLAMQQAIEDSGLEEAHIVNPRTGIIAGSGGASCKTIVWGADTLRERGVKRLGPFLVPKTMGSTVSACLATAFQIKGVNYSITSACATSSHCIGAAVEQIQMGKQDIVFAGGGEEGDWTLTMMFDAMGALSTQYNESPTTASRAYDANRDGFVIASGGGMVVLEEFEHARARGARIYAEVVGYAANSDGADMVAPSGEGAARCMRQAISGLETEVDYINTHGTSTPVGDVAELAAIREVFGSNVPPLSTSKSLCGHSLGATGVQEAIHCLLMLEQGFMLGSANIETLDERAEGFPILRETVEAPRLSTVLSNNFGFGGTNACLVFRKV